MACTLHDSNLVWHGVCARCQTCGVRAGVLLGMTPMSAGSAEKALAESLVEAERGQEVAR